MTTSSGTSIHTQVRLTGGLPVRFARRGAPAPGEPVPAPASTSTAGRTARPWLNVDDAWCEALFASALHQQLMDEDPDLSDVILRALMARRRYLRGGEAARSIEILGSEMSAGALALRTYTARQQLPHTWVEIDTPAGAALARAVAAAGGDLPVVITPTAVLRHATPALLTGQLGLSYQPVARPLLDLVIVGAGPAGLAAAVYDASEGLKTLLLDAAAAGGQAAASSRIENYLGFTSGISGAELTGRAAVQVQKFGARIASPSQAARLDTTHERLTALKHEGGTLDTYLANYGLFHLEADLRWIDMTAARLDALAREVRK